MTHSLHRSGDIESQKHDFVWFMYQTKGVNDVGIKPKALEFIAAAEAVHYAGAQPVLVDAEAGGIEFIEVGTAGKDFGRDSK